MKFIAINNLYRIFLGFLPLTGVSHVDLFFCCCCSVEFYERFFYKNGETKWLWIIEEEKNIHNSVKYTLLSNKKSFQKENVHKWWFSYQ